MLNKADAVFETEPLLLACVFCEHSSSTAASIKTVRQWRLDHILPMDLLGDLRLSEDAAVRFLEECIVCAPLELRLVRDEAQGYYLNLESPEPSIFCLLRFSEHAEFGLTPQVRDLTLSYEQAARWMDGGEQVERLPAPAQLLPWLAEFTQTHFEVPFKKAKNKNRPSFMSREEFDLMAKDEVRMHGKEMR
jgi:Protein of unknown function (DUF3305)